MPLEPNRRRTTDHVFFLLDGIPETDEWDVELRLIMDQIEVLGDNPQAILRKLCNREDKIKSSRAITAVVALYTKNGGFDTGNKNKDTDKSDNKDKKD
jgi:hypothetical protein